MVLDRTHVPKIGHTFTGVTALQRCNAQPSPGGLKTVWAGAKRLPPWSAAEGGTFFASIASDCFSLHILLDGTLLFC